MACKNIAVNKKKMPSSEDLLKTLNSRLIEEVARLRKEIKELQAVTAGVYNVSETARPFTATHPTHFDASAGFLTSFSLGATHSKASSASAQKRAKIKRYKGKEKLVNFCIKTDPDKVPKEDKDCLKSVGRASMPCFVFGIEKPGVGADSEEALASDDRDVPNLMKDHQAEMQGHKLAEDDNKCPESSSLSLVSNPPVLASISQLCAGIEVDSSNVGQENHGDNDGVGMPEDENHVECSEVLNDHITNLLEGPVTCLIDEYGCTDASIQQLEGSFYNAGDEKPHIMNIAVGLIDEDRQEQGSVGVDREIAATDVPPRENARKMFRWILPSAVIIGVASALIYAFSRR